MSTTLTYGYKKPSTGDRGSTFFPDLEGDIQQLNDHNHNGTNSSLLSIQAVSVTTQAIASGSWAATSGGTYKQTVTLPGTLTFDTVSMEFRLTTLKHVIYPSIEKVSANTYDIYINDNTLGVTAIYST
jgi:hypothetical protein